MSAEQLDSLSVKASESFKAGDLVAASGYLEKLLVERRREFGDNDARTLSTLSNLAVTYMKQYRLEEAKQVLNECLRRKEEKLGIYSEDTLETMKMLGDLLTYLECDDDAATIVTNYISTSTEKNGPNLTSMVDSINNLAIICYRKGLWSQACELLRDVIIIRSQIDTNDSNKKLIQSSQLLGDVYYQLGMYEDAATAYQQVVDLKTTFYGMYHTETLSSIHHMAKYYFNHKMYLFAVEKYELLYQRKVNNASTSNGSVSSGKSTHSGGGGGSGNDHYRLLYNIGNCFYHMNLYEIAIEKYFEYINCYYRIGTHTDIEIQERFLIIYLLGMCYYQLKDYDNAEQYIRQSVEERSEKFTEKHVDTCTSMYMLGNIYSEKSQYEEALNWYVKTYENRYQLLGMTHSSTITALSTVARLYFHTHNYREAEKYYVILCEQMKSIHGMTHRDTVAAFSNLAYLWKQLQKYEYAEPLYNELLIHYIQFYGPGHEMTMEMLMELGLTSFYSHNYIVAMSILKTCYEWRKAAYGLHHNHTIHTLQLLADAHLHQKIYKEAAYYYRELLTFYRPSLDNNLNNTPTTSPPKVSDMFTDTLPLDDDNTTISTKENVNMKNLIRNFKYINICYYHTQQYDKCLTVLEEHLSILKPYYTQYTTHRDVMQLLLNLAHITYLLKQYTQSEYYYQESLKSAELILGKNHIEYLSILNNMAIIYIYIHEYEKAIKLYHEVYEQRKAMLGRYDPDTLVSLNNLAASYANNKDYIKSAELYKKCIADRTHILGSEHPDTKYTVKIFDIILSKVNGPMSGTTTTSSSTPSVTPRTPPPPPTSPSRTSVSPPPTSPSRILNIRTSVNTNHTSNTYTSNSTTNTARTDTTTSTTDTTTIIGDNNYTNIDDAIIDDMIKNRSNTLELISPVLDSLNTFTLPPEPVAESKLYDNSKKSKKSKVKSRLNTITEESALRASNASGGSQNTSDTHIITESITARMKKLDLTKIRLIPSSQSFISQHQSNVNDMTTDESQSSNLSGRRNTNYDYYDIIDNDSNSSNSSTNNDMEIWKSHPLSQDPKYELYIKMMKNKVPEGAIRHKMMLNGLSYDEISYFFNVTTTHQNNYKLSLSAPTTPTTTSNSGNSTSNNLSSDNSYASRSTDTTKSTTTTTTTTNNNSKYTKDSRYITWNRLRYLKVPEIALRHKMTQETGFSKDELDDYFNTYMYMP